MRWVRMVEVKVKVKKERKRGRGGQKINGWTTTTPATAASSLSSHATLFQQDSRQILQYTSGLLLVFRGNCGCLNHAVCYACTKSTQSTDYGPS